MLRKDHEKILSASISKQARLTEWQVRQAVKKEVETLQNENARLVLELSDAKALIESYERALDVQDKSISELAEKCYA